MDPRRLAELRKQIPFEWDRPVTLADRLPIQADQVIGFTLLIAVYILLTCLPFALVFWVLGQVDDPDRVVTWMILARTFAFIWLGSGIWFFCCFLVYVVLDLKHPETLGRIPGIDSDDDAESEADLLAEKRRARTS